MLVMSMLLCVQLQEQVVMLEDQVREHSSKLRTTQVTLQHEEEMQTKLSNRSEGCHSQTAHTAVLFP